MRQVPRNLADDKPIHTGLPVNDMRHIVLTTVLNSLRKRGLVTMRVDTTHQITQQGRDALEQSTRTAQ